MASGIQSHRREIVQKIRFVSAAESPRNRSLQQQFQFQASANVTHSSSNRKGAGFRRLWEAYLTVQHV